MNKPSLFRAPLHPLDTETQTFGCRHSNPDFCGKNRLPKVCAFTRTDKICFAPPFSWPKQFKKLQAEKSKSE
jgi:predicted nucleic acid binding AN1-type Zn finger protein